MPRVIGRTGTMPEGIGPRDKRLILKATIRRINLEFHREEPEANEVSRFTITRQEDKARIGICGTRKGLEKTIHYRTIRPLVWFFESNISNEGFYISGIVRTRTRAVELIFDYYGIKSVNT